MIDKIRNKLYLNHKMKMAIISIIETEDRIFLLEQFYAFHVQFKTLFNM